MSLLVLGPVAFGGTPGIISFLQRKRVLARQKQCLCGAMMVLQDRADISDGCRWRCPDCRTGVSIRKGSFFEKSKLTLQKWLLLMHWWAKQYPVKDAAEEIGVSEATAIQVYSWMRDVCSYRLCTLDPQIKLGGTGIVVSIDESLFSHKPKFCKN
jgi:transposase-like protein